jgi:tRNA(adenine34) deaminase
MVKVGEQSRCHLVAPGGAALRRARLTAAAGAWPEAPDALQYAPSLGRAGPDPLLMDDQSWMRVALAEARRAAELGEVPVGAVVVQDGRVVGSGHNRREVDGDPLAHAELLAIRQAAEAVKGWRLVGCTMFVTLEPCAMCAGALVNSRVERLVFGAADPKAGFCGSLGDLSRDPRLNHRLEVVSGVLAEECGALLRDFFRGLRSVRSGSLQDSTAER